MGLAPAEGHVLYEPDLVGVVSRKACEVEDFILVEAPGHHRVYLYGPHGGGLNGFKPCQHLIQAVEAGYGLEALPPQGVEAYVEPVDARLF